MPSVVLEDCIYSTQSIQVSAYSEANSSTTVSETIQVRDSESVSDVTAESSSVVSAVNLTLASDPVSSASTASTLNTTSAISQDVITESSKASVVVEELLSDATTASESITTGGTSAVTVNITDAVQVSEAVTAGQWTTLTSSVSSVSDGYRVSGVVETANITRSSQSVQEVTLLSVSSTASVVESVSVFASVWASSVSTVGETLTVSTSGEVETVSDRVQSQQVIALAPSSTIATVQSIAYAYERTYSVEGEGIIVSVTYPDKDKYGVVGPVFAHGLHTLPPVIWAYNGEARVVSGKVTFDGGNTVMSAKLGIGKIDESQKISIKSLWVPRGITRNTRVYDSIYSRPPQLRGDEARFIFGRGSWRHYWLLEIENFITVPEVEVKVNISDRRY